MTYSQYLAQEVRAEAARKRLTGRELARRVEAGGGLGHGSVARMLRGERPWDVETLSTIAEALGLSVSDLIRRADEAMTVNRCSLPSLSASVNPQVSGLLVSA